MSKQRNLYIVFFFTALTVVLTVVVVMAWEKILMPPFYSLIETYYPGDANSVARWRTQQRFEHIFISTVVDVIVVTLLLRLVGRQQRKLAASEERYRAIFEHANDGIVIVSSESRTIIEVNNKFCELFGCRPPELIGQDIRTLAWGATADGAGSDGNGATSDGGGSVDTLAAFLDANSCADQELSIRTSAGAMLPVSVSCSTLSMDEDRLLVLLVRDWSIRKRLEAEKEEMQRQLFHNEKISALGRVAAQVAHEVKNPLTGLLLYAMHLKSKLSGKLPENELVLCDRIINSVNHLVGTTEQILSFARPVTLAPRPLDLNGVVRKVVQLLQPQINAYRIEERLELPDTEVIALLDETSITSALINLTLNSIQSMPEGGRLTVKTSRVNGTSQLTIADTGCGMTAEQIEKVFEPFYTTKSQGLGLGMPYAKKVIEQHHGEIHIESRRDAGTQIIIELPSEK
ncbi:MAG: two-component system, NtrC family, sensor histidine kinase HydH [Pyrinomonadaceae bacterium]|jgi:signal transduction histidine kinase|nr:two-component system, NtrC family, sensor histidine kinase HydH [Pyrinomonadaceae bacterium]